MIDFTIEKISKKSRARLGVISTSSGKIHTPAFVPVATKGTVKGLLPAHVAELGVEVAFVNTYHLMVSPGLDALNKVGGIKAFSGLPCPLMSDSGGFQVFSLGTHKRMSVFRGEDDKSPLIKISEEGVRFRSLLGGGEIVLSPEASLEAQRIIRADLIMAFDECTFYPADRDYTKKAMERTHRWLERSIGAWKADSGSGTPQHLYGIIQGGAYEDLRKESARFVASKDVDGVAIGGVSVGEPRELMRKELGWVSDFLPHEKPVHLLGVGRIADFVDLVALGIDTFDCAEPTRLSREGKIYRLAEMDFSEIVSQKDDERGMWMDITSPRYRLDTSPLGRGCGCAVCTRFSKSYLHHLFRQREISAYVLATYHNVYSIMRLFQDIRAAIVSGVL